MKLVIVTGMSGAGKTQALKMLEDMGYYCVDNLPISLVNQFTELSLGHVGESKRIALGVDIRSGEELPQLKDVLKGWREKGFPYWVLFLDAGDEVLIKRYKETRRMHPLSLDGRIEDGIRKERKVLNDIRNKSDYVIDTSNLLTRELKEELERIFVQNEEYNSLMVTILSFGFKHGIRRMRIFMSR